MWLHYNHVTARQLCDCTTTTWLHYNYMTARQLCDCATTTRLRYNYVTTLQLCGWTTTMWLLYTNVAELQLCDCTTTMWLHYNCVTGLQICDCTINRRQELFKNFLDSTSSEFPVPCPKTLNSEECKYELEYLLSLSSAHNIRLYFLNSCIIFVSFSFAAASGHPPFKQLVCLLFDVLIAVNIEITLFCEVMACRLLSTKLHVFNLHCLIFHDQWVSPSSFNESSGSMWSKPIHSTIKIQYLDSSDFPFHLKNCPFIMLIVIFFN